MPRHSASRSRSPILDTGLPDNDIWFVLVDVNAATCCSTGDKAVTQDPSTEENEENKVATQDPYMTIPSMTIPRKKRKKKKRSLTKKEKEKKSEKEKEKKAERSTVKMYYWNVALPEHCEEVPLECGSGHWNTEEVCEVAPFTQCHCWDEEAAQFRQERELQKVATQQIVRQPLVVAYQQKELHCRMCNAQE